MAPRSKYLRGEDPRQLLEKEMRAGRRLPPGQSATIKWPVLHAGEVPAFDPAAWNFRTWGEVETPLDLGWDAFSALPRKEVVTDFHCVTRWSTFDNRWQGVPVREVLARTRPAPGARYVMALGHLDGDRYGYSTNVPLADLDRDDTLLVTGHDGAPLDPEHGGPLRLLVPHLYAWKSCKWIRALVFMERDQAGFWENAGYHMRGDPWREERHRA
jgi:DMSO/TMAO reductase YedYZ molybdopterin-dependent catalytic subunit